jgi:hypothetical protein
MSDKATRNTAKIDQDSPVITRGLGLKESEWQFLEHLSHELGLNSKHAMTAYAVRYFIKQYQEGNIKMTTQPTLPEV